MSWILDERHLIDAHSPASRAVLLAVGNGTFCTLAGPPEGPRDAHRGTYVSGLFTEGPLGLSWLMQAPDGLGLWLRTPDGPPVQPEQAHQQLDMRTGTLERAARFALAGGSAETAEQRFASWAHRQQFAQRWTVRPSNLTGPIELVLALDADVAGYRTKYYKDMDLPAIEGDRVRLSRPEHLAASEEGLFASVVSEQTGVRAAVAAQVRQIAGPELPVRYEVAEGRAMAIYTVEPGLAELAFEKIGTVHADVPGHSRCPTPGNLADRLDMMDWAKATARHGSAMDAFWNVAEVAIEGDADSQLAIRFAAWSTRIAAPDNDGASSIGARNLAGDMYRGGVFWDMEMFQLPLLAAVAPERARNHLLYRARCLPAARRLARRDGFAGARYPWTAYATGTDDGVDNPNAVGYQEIHVNLAVAWGMVHYLRMTGDTQTFLAHGLEVLLEIARYFLSRCEGPDAAGHVHIRNVCGPDEFALNVDDNAYTNVLTGWLWKQCSQLVAELRPDHGEQVEQVLKQTGVDASELARWADLAGRLHTETTASGALAQYASFDETPEPDTVLNQGRWGRIDKTAKQADVLMLAHVLPEAMDEEVLRRCWREYAPLCVHFSSLSVNTHAIIAARLGLAREAEIFYRTSAGIDLAGDASDGIHGAGEGGLWQNVVIGFGGLRCAGDVLTVDPALPAFWKSLRYRLLHHGQLVEVTVTADRVRAANLSARPVEVDLAGQRHAVSPGRSATTSYAKTWQEPKLQAVLFDLDGVLVTTDTFHYQAWKALADELGMDFDEQVNHRLRGISRAESLKVIYRHNGRELPDEATFTDQCTRKNDQYRALVAAMTPEDVLPGSLELLESLQARGIKLAIASASRNTPLVLERTGLARWFDAVADGNIARASKPAPDVFELACQRLRVLPCNAVGIEDAAAGVEAIHRAGCVSVGVGDQASEADVCVDTPQDLSADLLAETFQRFADRAGNR